jgi:hypothetical protein
VDDPRGHSYGSGTIVDVHDGDALVVTCGHIFRDSQGKGRIVVDLFGSLSGQTVIGTLVGYEGYDLDRDVGLIGIRPPGPVRPATIAGPEHRLQPGQAVFSVGCDRGGQPRRMQGRITAVNRYAGPPNLAVTGQPVDGRSGGGLFTADGVLIGVCNAADPQDDEGLYAAAGSIHAELDRAGLSFVYSRPAGPAPPIGRLADIPSPAAPAIPVLPAIGPAVTRGAVQPQPLAPAGDSEVICIVRSRSNPQAASRVIVLEQPSGDFLQRLLHEADSSVPRLAEALPDARQPWPADSSGASGSGGQPVPVVRGQGR